MSRRSLSPLGVEHGNVMDRVTEIEPPGHATNARAS